LIDFRGVHFDKLPISQAGDNRDLLHKLFDNYAPEFLGLCFDSGHANLGYDRMEQLENFLDRLIVLHLNSNDGTDDQHHNLFVDPIDWERLAKYIAASVYTKPMSLEVIVSDADKDEGSFLQTAFETGNRFAEMVDRYRS
jgi:sugar phosphate isomerase/epimerase